MRGVNTNAIDNHGRTELTRAAVLRLHTSNSMDSDFPSGWEPPPPSDIDSDDSCTSYDSESTEFKPLRNHDYQIHRLAPARAISAAGIDCIVWGHDALEFAHRVPASEVDCHLLVDDEFLPISAELLATLGYSPTEPDPQLLDHACWNPARPHAYPDSIRLRHRVAVNSYTDPVVARTVLLTPMSFYHVQKSWCTDPSRTLSLPHPGANRLLRYPTLFAYLDSLIATYLEPKHGRHRWWEFSLRADIESLVWSSLKKQDCSGIGKMSEAEERVLLGVRKENQLFVKRKLVFCIDGCWEQWQKERRMVLSERYEVGGCSCRRCAETEMIL